MSPSVFKQQALSLPEVQAHPHFERLAFKVPGRKIFTTLLEGNATANIVLLPEDQLFFCNADPAHIRPVPNKWGARGWTCFDLVNVEEGLVRSALLLAYEAS
ncbi:MmcQ/YjbR family DNA-binding protein [Niabella terrae]